MRYLPHTPEDIARMLRVIGAPSVEALFAHIPETLRAERPLDLGPALDEASLLAHLAELAARGRASGAEGSLSFLGGGLTPHHVPTAVDALLQRAEWYTSYTPYQPEISQGTLQAVFEFQTLVAELFGLAIANASMYDGASATAEAILMARRITGRTHAVISSGLHPHYLETAETYLSGLHPHAEQVFGAAQLDGTRGQTDPATVEAAIVAAGDGGVCCVVVQTPNYFGVVEDLAPLAEVAHRHGALLVAVTTEPVAFGALQPPGALGADIACGEGIGLASGPSLGGPGVGLFAARAEHTRSMPGRLVGETVDRDGQRGYVLTLATREQHIRREKATSNICTNQGLCALAFTIHACLLGRRGLAELAALNLAKAEYAKGLLSSLRGFSLCYSGPTFNEFALRVRGGNAAHAVDTLAGDGLFAGVALACAPDTLLVAVTEKHRKEDIERLARSLDKVCP
ncbi:MAG: aminomethyl-transferring glycine dehydrogenase subunit GcvPA [Myxococcales bacterium]|nr:aminomethyl-transferring glycine dehydrogenase subunit GcvPA [Myxococcales bacterium]